MAVKKSVKSKEEVQRKELTETQRWVYGFLLLGFAVFLLVAVVSYYFYWAKDQSFVYWGDIWAKDAPKVVNHAGKLGAVLANYIVGQWFGIFGIVIPIVLIILSLRIMRYRPMFLRRSVRVGIIIMILGSLSMGYLFATRWSVFGTGLGGAHGIFVSQWLDSFLGTLGEGILLLFSWILLGVYINKSTISVVNKVGKGIVDNTKKVGGVVIHQATDLVGTMSSAKKHEGVASEGEDEDDIPLEIESIRKEAFVSSDPIFAPEGENVMHAQEVKIESDLMAEPIFEITDSRIVREGQAPVVFAQEQNVEEDDNIVAPWDDEPNELVDNKPGRAIVRIEDTEFEVVDRSGASLSVGGIVEANAGGGGLSVGDKLEVVAAGYADVEIGEDEEDPRLYDPRLELSKFKMPVSELLEDHSINVKISEEDIHEHKNQIIQTLKNFGIKIDKIKATIGPTVTLYEIVPAAGVKISKIKNLEDDIALSLKALGIRIIAPMPGKGTIGIEVPNKEKEIVSMSSVIRSLKFQESDYELPVVLGKTIQNETYIIDLAKMPHLLVAGSTGQGKSVGLNAIITSLLYKKHPAELKFVLVDPKKVELSLYSKLEKHYLAKMESEDEAILTDTAKVVHTLNSLCNEMQARYDLLRMAGVRKLSEYNDKFLKRRLNPQKGHRFMPYIVVVIDEFADMIMTAGREVEIPITRLAQLARAVGIHLVIATQRPDVKVITGLIKANFPARIAFRVTSMIDSRTILDQPGANQLIGRGDMLIALNGEVTRVQCAFIDTPEIERITEYIGNQRGFAQAYLLPDYSPEDAGGDVKSADTSKMDSMFEEVARYIVQYQQGSTSSIQRRFSIGYNRAGRIMDQMEAVGIVGRAEGSKPREVLVVDEMTVDSIISRYAN